MRRQNQSGRVFQANCSRQMGQNKKKDLSPNVFVFMGGGGGGDKGSCVKCRS